MTVTDDRNTFARFWKCALQVNSHSYGASYRGHDHGMDGEAFGKALREICHDQGVSVVGLADHGSVDDSEVVRRVLAEGGIVVFPGFEVATSEKVHWVCLFPEDTPYRQLVGHLAQLGISPTADSSVRTQPLDWTGQQLLSKVAELGGFCFGAHVTSSSGLLERKLNNLWTDPGLSAAQIPGSVNDLPQEYRSIALNRNPSYQRERRMALINAKDVAVPEDIRHPSASTLIKMTRPCFASFLMAFKDPESRVRLVSGVEEHYYSQIKTVRIEGGYFDGLTARLSDHLNAVIGGRGTGKSTLLECLRYALDVPHKGKDAAKLGDQIVLANLGKAGGRVVVEVVSQASYMKPYKVVRRYGEPPRVIDENGDESSLNPARDLLPRIEIYGQNEIFELASSPDELARVLDRFLPDSAERRQQLESAYRNLNENGERLLKALANRDSIESQIRRLPKLEEQVRNFREQGLEEKLKQVPLLEKEKQLGPRIRSEVVRVRDGHDHFQESLPDLVFLSERALEGLPHADLLGRARKVIEVLSDVSSKKLREIERAIGDAESEINNILDELRSELETSDTQLEREFSKLPTMAGKAGPEIGRAYQGLLREIEQISPEQTRLRTADTLVKELRQNRRNLLGEISDLRSARTGAKQKAVKHLNKRLKGKLRITVAPDGLRQPLSSFLRSLPGVGPRKTGWVDDAEGLTVMGLVAAARKGKDSLLKEQWGMTQGVAETLASLSAESQYELESIDVDDQVNIELNVSHEGETYRHLDQLSTGQKCTAILHLLLLDNSDPLLMDQPEDNLDNAFIAERIVQELRQAKTERQFLFATHNANIPVFGDAEWIGVCRATDDRAAMPEQMQGSIDIPEIRDCVANILEGGREAFMQRKEKYGFDY